jgi:hypothetical protein
MSGNQGGSHEQHVKAGQQSHKNSSPSDSKTSSREERGQMSGTDQDRAAMGGSQGLTRGGTHEQHVKADQQSHKNT